MPQKISGYTADGTSNPLKNEDLLDVSNEDGGGGFDVSKKITVAELLTFINSGVVNLYNADGTLLSDRIVTAQTFFTQFLGGDVEVKMSDEVTDYAFIVKDQSDGKMAIFGYDQGTTSGEIQLLDGGGLFLEAKNGNLNLLGGTNLNLVTGNIEWNPLGFNTGTLNVATLTLNRTWDLPNKSGTIALVENGFVGNSLFVSSAGVSIAMGAVRESLLTHFNSMSEALSSSLAGDTIYVFGDQTPNANLYKDGVTWEYMGNPTITNNQALYNDGGVAGTCVIRGNADFQSTNGVFNFTGAGTVVDIECQNAVTTSGVAVQLIGAVGTISVRDTTQSGTGAVVYLDGATDVTLNSKFINGNKSDGRVFNVQTGFTGKLIVNGELATATGNTANAYIVCCVSGGASSGTLIFNIDFKHTGTTTPICVRPDSHTVTVNGNIDGGTGYAIRYFTGTANSKFTHNGDATNDGTLPCVLIGDTDVSEFNLNGTYTSSNANVIEQSNANSTLKINGRIENTNALAVPKSGVLITNNLATILDSVIIILDVALGTPVCVGASVAKNMKVFKTLGSNANADANVTNLITGANFNVDLDYQ